MTFVYIFLCIIVMSVATRLAVKAHNHKSLYGYSKSEIEGISWVGREVIKGFNSLPENHKPYGNIKAIVTALDTKYTIDKVNNHFKEKYYDRGSGYGEYKYRDSWECSCYKHKPCAYPEYRNFIRSFIEIKEAVANQQYRLAVAGQSDALNEAEALTVRLREEKELIDQVTKELA